MSESLIIEERPTPDIARILLNRPRTRNAQNLDMLRQLDAAFMRAAADDSVKVILLGAEGPDFSSGHDLRKSLDQEPAERFSGVGVSSPGGQGYMAREADVYLGLCRKWRDLPKPTIAQVQGRCIAGGLMLAWVCDLIIASDDALFMDPVVAMGISGVEWFAHPWELGPRKAKELLFTGAAWSAAEAHRLGMVNHVVPQGELASFTLQLAERIAQQPALALKATKEAVNATLDYQGQRNALDYAFNLHHLCHYHNVQTYGSLGDPNGMPSLDKTAKPKDAAE
ncbi:MAG: enoyl-CoA hydratase [Caulobacterales bacterium]